MKRFRHIIALTLVIALLVQLLPVTVFATEEETASITETPELLEEPPAEEAAPETIPEQNAPVNADILHEVIELRDENIKHFRMDNGAYLAVEYDSPIHYQDAQGNWEEYNNTLTATRKAGNVTGYRIQNGDSSRIFSADPLEDHLLYVSKGSYSLSLAPYQEDRADSDHLTTEIEDVTIPVTVLTTAAPVALQFEDELMAQVQPQKFYSALEYGDAFEGAVLRYENYGSTVKESIIISAPQESYRYTFKMALNDLFPTLEDDGSVVLRSAEHEVIYIIPAPYMIDADNVYSADAFYELEADADGWLLSVTADAEWMNSADRAFPVLLDPTIQEDTSGSISVTAGYTNQTYPNTVMSDGAGGLYLGSSGYGTDAQRSYFHIDNLISLPDGCEVINAQFSIYHYYHTNVTGNTPLEVGLYSLSSPSGWTTWSTSLTWNQAASTCLFDDIIVDRQYMSTSTSGSNVSFDITTLARRWYADSNSNYGFLLKSVDESAASSWATLHGPTKTWGRPSLTITYRNTVGLESYYTYQTAGVARAGTSYLNDFTLQNTLVVPLASNPSDTLPFSVSLVYNSGYAKKQFTTDTAAIKSLHVPSFGSMLLGLGWKLSLQETVTSATIDGITHLIYNDADGTEHYFRYDSSTGYYRDEDGLGLWISRSGSSYTMYDNYGNTKYFAYGYLTYIKDAYNNYLCYCYNNAAYSSASTSWYPNSGTTNKLTAVIRRNTGSNTNEQLLQIGYTGNYLTTIIDCCNYADAAQKNANTITLIRDGFGRLTEIAYPDSVSAIYRYDTNHRMLSAYDSGTCYGLEYSYNTKGMVTGLKEYKNTESGSIFGSKIGAEKVSPFLTVYRSYGKDGIANNEDDFLNRYVFDAFGRTTTSYTTDASGEEILGVGAAGYTANSGINRDNNRLTLSAGTGQQRINLLKNSSAEDAYYSAFAIGIWERSSESNAPIGLSPYVGEYSLNLTRSPSSSETDLWYQPVTLDTDKAYTLSAYINVPEDVTFSDGGGVYLAFLDSADAPIVQSEIVDYTTAESNNGWMRISVTLPANSPPVASIALCGSNYEGTIHSDAFQLEEGIAASSYNLLDNSSFERYTNTGSNVIPTYSEHVESSWYRTGDTAVSDAEGATPFGSKYLTLSGDDSYQRIAQDIWLNMPQETTFIFSAWTKANAIPGSAEDTDDTAEPYFGLIARLYYSDNTSEPFWFPCNPYYDGWQYTHGVITPKTEKAENVKISKITVVVAYDNNINEAYVDNVSLYIEPAQTYSYDSEGFMKSATEAGSGTSGYTYSNANLTNYTAANGVEYNYTYNSQHDVLTASADSVTNTYTYDTSGNRLTALVTHPDNGYYLYSGATAGTDRNHLVSVTDVNGSTTEYLYDYYTEQLLRATNGKGVSTWYEYDDSNGRIKSTYINAIASVIYNYNDSGTLANLQRKTYDPYGSTTAQYQRYNFSYNDWDQTSQITVSASPDNTSYTTGATLATYDYFDFNVAADSQPAGYSPGALRRMAYGNNDAITYKYDDYGRLEEVYHEDTQDKIVYVYNGDGALAELHYHSGGSTEATTVYQFEYDSLGRLIRSRELDGDKNLIQRTEHRYDAFNRLSAQHWAIGNQRFSESYVYDDPTEDNKNADGSLKQMTTANGDTIDYTYDDLNRMRSTTVKSGSKTLFTNAYAYKTIGLRTAYQSSLLVEFNNIRDPQGELLIGQMYEYDALGNISAIYESEPGGINSTRRVLVRYAYDDLNQLISETYYSYKGTGITPNTTEVYTYTYDTAGNILTERKNGTLTKTYTYGNSGWNDLLTAINNEAILYDECGNAQAYRNATGIEYDLYWENGRQLSAIELFGEAALRGQYAYDADGIRTQKTLQFPASVSETHNYVTQNGKVVRETITDKDGNITILDFIYDESGRPFALLYYANGAAEPETYYYLLNLQGDVVALMDSSGSIIAKYTYSAWGEIRSVTNASGTVITSETHIAHLNPLRYRGYYYDTETGFYYLQSRYYDPVTHRFINADAYASSGQDFAGTNMFAYCGNNPVNRYDLGGNSWVEFWEALKVAFTDAKPAFVAAGGVAMLDSPAPGYADVAGSAIATLAAIYCVVVAVDAKNTAKPSEREKEETYTAALEKTKRRRPVFFPSDPYSFNPKGLIRIYRNGTKNGSFITWHDPVTNIVVFRWDENINYSNGSHYHILYDKTIHYYPGDEVPEPFASNYFPEFT